MTAHTLARHLIAGLIGVGACAAPAIAQTGQLPRGRYTITGGGELDARGLSQSSTLTKQVESAPLSAAVPRAVAPFFEAGVDVRVVGGLGVSVAFGRQWGDGEAGLTAAIPHPFFFNAHRDISGQVSGVRHEEVVLHTNALYIIGTERLDVSIGGGASFFRITQDVVSDVTYTEEYPYDTASFVSANLARVRVRKVGYNALADLTWKASDRWGFGGQARFNRVRVPLEVDDIDYGTHTYGGLQVGGGVRVMF
jgi:hypothetical protein